MASAEETIDFGQSDGASDPWAVPEPPLDDPGDDEAIDWGTVEETERASEPRRRRSRLFRSWQL